jgi:hypothetical protein
VSQPTAQRGLPPGTPEPATAAGWQAVADGPDFLEVLAAAGVDPVVWAGLDDEQRGCTAELVVRDGWPVEEALRVARGEPTDSA